MPAIGPGNRWNLAGRGSLDAKRQAVWREWVGTRDGRTTAASSPYVEVAEPVGRLFLFAVETSILEADGAREDPDGDAGNDLEFLHTIQATLTQDLEQRARAEQAEAHRLEG